MIGLKDAHGNSGFDNSGTKNLGDYNSGHMNVGDCNAGDSNYGDNNTGSENSGSLNAGSFNTGNANTGMRNEGDRNSGDCNRGDGNSGDYNIGNRHSGCFNTGEHKILMFNRPSDWTIVDWELSDAKKVLEKLRRSIERGREAANDAWGRLTEKEREAVRTLPNFDAKIFEQCTGIDIGNLLFL